MNELVSKVTAIESSDSLTLVYFEFERAKLVMMSLEMGDSLNVGDKVVLSVKSTAIFIQKESAFKHLAANRLKAKIKKISNAKLLSSLQLQVAQTVLESVMIQKDVRMLNLKEGDEVDLYFLASELFVKKVFDD